MKITRSICLALAAAFLTSPVALADNPKLSSNINKSQQARAERLQKGVRPGELTQKEVAELAEEHRQLEKNDAPQR